MAPHLPPHLSSLGVPGPESLVEQEGLQQLGAPLTPGPGIHGETPSHPLGLTVICLAG